MSLLEKVKKHVNSAEILTVSSESVDVSFTAGEIKASQRKGTFGSALRVLKDGRIGFSSAVGVEDEDLLVRNALESAEFGDEVQFDFAPAAEGPDVQTYHDSVPALTITEMVDMGKKVVDKLKKAEDGLQIDVHLGRNISESKLETTNGAHVAEKDSSFGLSASIERIDGNDILLLYHGEVSVGVEDFTDIVPTRIIERLEASREIVSLESGPMPVIFPPRAMMTLLLPLLQPKIYINLLQAKL